MRQGDSAPPGPARDDPQDPAAAYNLNNGAGLACPVVDPAAAYQGRAVTAMKDGQ
jgi:hypothetical protein